MNGPVEPVFLSLSTYVNGTEIKTLKHLRKKNENKFIFSKNGVIS